VGLKLIKMELLLHQQRFMLIQVNVYIFHLKHLLIFFLMQFLVL